MLFVKYIIRKMEAIYGKLYPDLNLGHAMLANFSIPKIIMQDGYQKKNKWDQL